MSRDSRYWATLRSPIFLILIHGSLVVSSGCVAPAVVSQTRVAPEPRISPWSVSANAPVLDGGATPSIQPHSNSFTEFAFEVYRKVITPIDGPRCEHTPSCSRYSVEATREHGFVMGLWLTMDRLVRGGRSSVLRPLPIEGMEGGKPKYRDELEDNDFFL